MATSFNSRTESSKYSVSPTQPEDTPHRTVTSQLANTVKLALSGMAEKELREQSPSENGQQIHISSVLHGSTNPPALPPRQCHVSDGPRREERERDNHNCLSLLQFIEKYSDSLPAHIRIEKGHYGSNDPETFGLQEKLMISLVKSRKVLSITTSTLMKFVLPLGSAIQLSLLYNPDGNEERARQGYTFQSVRELMAKSPCLPIVICATKAVKGDSFGSTLFENEILVVKEYNTYTKKLKVISVGTTPVIQKLLPLKCNGCFTTKPSSVRIYVSDINNYIGTTGQGVLHAVLDLSEATFTSNGAKVDKSLYGVVQLTGFVTERSLLGTRLMENWGSSAEPKAFEIFVNENLSNVEVAVIETNLTLECPPLSSFDDQLESLYQEESTATSNVQRVLYDYVRYGYEREGVTINAGHIYDEPLDPELQSQPPHTMVSSAYKQSSAKYGMSANDPNKNTSVSSANKLDSMHTTTEHVNITKTELEMTIRTVLSEVMTEKQKSIPDWGGTDDYTYTSMDQNESKV